MDIIKWSKEDLDKAITALEASNDLWPIEDGGYVDQIYDRLWKKLQEEKERKDKEQV